MRSVSLFIVLLSCHLAAFEQNATYLVLNHFDKPLVGINESLINNFSNSTFNFDSSVDALFGDIDKYNNPASSYMNDIKELGDTYNVNFILLNRIEHREDRVMIEGLLFNTRSGGLIHRRKINLKNYDNGLVNELSLWVASTMNQIQKQWEKEREALMFLDSEDITYDKTPMGAALRSLVVPGWGQAYSGNSLSAGLWATIQLSLSVAFISSYNNYDSSAKSFLENVKLYDATDDEKEVEMYRTSAERDWNDHVGYSKLAIALAGTTLTGWVSNSIHAWVFGPRPFTNIYQKGISQSTYPKG